jgi:hypothetical protein
MLEEIDKIISELSDTSNGWVDRRDAADNLGMIASKALMALHAHAEDGDVDVRTAVQAALEKVGVSAGTERAAPSEKSAVPVPTLKDLAQACEKKMKRAIKPHGDGYVVRVQTKEGRTQDVHITPVKRPDGRELIRVSTQCGEADADTIAWAIRSNAKLMHCAFCVHTHDDQEQIMLARSFTPDQVSTEMVKNTVKEMAFYGDWLEKKLTGEDSY